MTVVTAFDLIFPPVVCVDVPKQMSFGLIVAEDSFVALPVLVDKACWRNLADKVKADSVDGDCSLHLIKVFKVEIYSVTRKIVISLAAFFNTSLKT